MRDRPRSAVTGRSTAGAARPRVGRPGVLRSGLRVRSGAGRSRVPAGADSGSPWGRGPSRFPWRAPGRLRGGASDGPTRHQIAPWPPGWSPPCPALGPDRVGGVRGTGPRSPLLDPPDDPSHQGHAEGGCRAPDDAVSGGPGQGSQRLAPPTAQAGGVLSARRRLLEARRPVRADFYLLLGAISSSHGRLPAGTGGRRPFPGRRPAPRPYRRAGAGVIDRRRRAAPE